MDFNLTTRQVAIQELVSSFLAKDYSFEKRCATLNSSDGFSRENWRLFAELGLLGVPFPEQFGGFNGNAVDVMLVSQGFGRGLVVEPYLSTVVLSGCLIRDAGSQAQKQELLPAIARGEMLMALACAEPGSRYELNCVGTTGRRQGVAWKLTGMKAVVLAGDSADKLIVPARTGGGARERNGISLFLVDPSARGVTVRGYSTHDDRRAAEIELNGVNVSPDSLIGEEGGGIAALECAVDRAIAAVCAEAVGAMAALNELTLEHLKTRKQFGRPIGSFQVLQHRMVDMIIATEQARSMAIFAAVKADAESAIERRQAASASKAFVGQQGRYVGQQAVQLHGGMGVVKELNIAHYFKRLTMLNAMFGDADHHLAAFSDGLCRSMQSAGPLGSQKSAARKEFADKYARGQS